MTNDHALNIVWVATCPMCKHRLYSTGARKGDRRHAYEIHAKNSHLGARVGNKRLDTHDVSVLADTMSREERLSRSPAVAKTRNDYG
jgi:hypothetical protein